MRLNQFKKQFDPRQLKPVDVSIGLDDQIVVLDRSQDSRRVVILNKRGELMKLFGLRGYLDGRFSNPFGVDVDVEKVELLLLTLSIIEFKCLRMMDLFIRSFGSKGSSKGQENKISRKFCGQG